MKYFTCFFLQSVSISKNFCLIVSNGSESDVRTGPVPLGRTSGHRKCEAKSIWTKPYRTPRSIWGVIRPKRRLKLPNHLELIITIRSNIVARGIFYNYTECGKFIFSAIFDRSSRSLLIRSVCFLSYLQQKCTSS